MLTKTQYNYYSVNAMAKGVASAVEKESSILQLMPFMDVEGNAYAYNQEGTEATAQWYSIGDTWVESAPVTKQRTTSLAILGGDVDIDNFAQATMSNYTDIRASQVEYKAKAISHEWEKQFIWGGTTTTEDDKSFEGIVELLCHVENQSSDAADLDAANNAQVVDPDPGGNNGTLTFIKLDELIDCVRPGRPDCLIMTREARRYLNYLTTVTSASVLRVTTDEFGNFIEQYNGHPIYINDFILNNQADAGTRAFAPDSYDWSATPAGAADNTIIFAVKFGLNALHGVQNGPLTTTDMGQLETKDAERVRIKWYTGLCMRSSLAAEALISINIQVT